MMNFNDLMDGYNVRALIERECTAGELADDAWLYGLADTLRDDDTAEPTERGLFKLTCAVRELDPEYQRMMDEIRIGD